jgi:hypothetical protein
MPSVKENDHDDDTYNRALVLAASMIRNQTP